MQVYRTVDRQFELRLNDDEQLSENLLPPGYHLRDLVKVEHSPNESREWYESDRYDPAGNPINPKWRSLQEPGMKAHTLEGE